MRELRALGVDPPSWNPQAPARSFLLRDGALRRTPGGPRTLFALGGWLRRVAARPDGLAGVSVAEWLDGELRDPAAREAAAALVRVTTFVADHERLSADVAAAQIRIGLSPGCATCAAAGSGWSTPSPPRPSAAARSCAPAAPCRRSSRAARGWTVLTDDAEHEADAVIVAAGQPAAVAKLVGDRTAPPGPPAEVSSLDLGLRRLPRRGRTFALGLDEPSYCSVHSPPQHPHGVLLSLASYAAQPRDVLEGIADRVQPGWRDEVTLQRHLPRMTAVSAIATPATGGLAGRPPVTVAGAPGLYLAGDWIGAEGWLTDAALASAAEAARALLAAPRAVLA